MEEEAGKDGFEQKSNGEKWGEYDGFSRAES